MKDSIENQLHILDQNQDRLVEFMETHEPACGFPIYSSMDVRDAGWKISVVDVNIFPAGWNNLTAKDSLNASERFRNFFINKFGSTSLTQKLQIGLVPESHTSNLGYLENIYGLKEILKAAGVDVNLIWSGDPIPKPWKVKTLKGNTLEYLPAAEALSQCQAVILNHDMSGGIPKILQNVTLPIFPSTGLGWFRRRKSNHQKIFESLLFQIKKIIPEFDPFFFSPVTVSLENIDFSSDESTQRLHETGLKFLEGLDVEYQKRNIPERPRFFIKNDSGTYGMGVLSVKNVDDLKEIPRKMKNKMKVGKDSIPITRVIMQETIPTGLTYNTGTGTSSQWVSAEPVVYIVDGNPVGGFLRVHGKLGPDSMFENLNQPGGSLEPLECPNSEGNPPRPFPKLRSLNTCQQLGTKQIYGFLAKLHSVAAGLEDCLNEKSDRQEATP
jgi:glutamate--cysteine ligase